MIARTALRQGYLDCRSFTSTDISALAAGSYDIMLLAASWDARCVSITKAKGLHASVTVGICFDARDRLGLRDKHDKELGEFSRANSDRFCAITGSSTKVDAIWEQLKAQLFAIAEAKKRPLTMIIDLSACPRFFSLGALALGLNRRIARNISIIYAEGQYPEPGADLEVAFTGGRWRTVAVPYLEGICDPGKNRFYLVSVGFEGSKTLRSVSQADPDRVSVLLPSPGSSPEYVQRALDSNAELIRQFRIPIEQIVKADAVDAMASLRTLQLASVDRRANENSYYICCGSKPHSLALALRALALENPAVLYNIPEEHTVHYTKPTGQFWRYDIRDVTARL